MTDAKSERVRTAIVGLGMGWHHIEPFRRHPQCDVVAVCDADAGKAKRACEHFSVARAFESIDDLLDWNAFDLVSIVLPNDLHLPVTVRFLEAGKHVLAEKPLARTAAEGRKIVEAARKAGTKCALHMNQRMGREHQLIRRAAVAGDLGDLHYIRTGWMRHRGVPAWGAGGWFTKKARSGGGPLIDLGVHMIDSALWIAGFPRVLTIAGQTIYKEGIEVETFASARLRCEGDLTISVEVSWDAPHESPNEAFMHVYGSRAGAHRRTRFDINWVPTTEFHFSRETLGALTREEVVEWPSLPGAGASATVQEDLVQAILDDREPRCTLEQGLMVMEILDAIYESARGEREVGLEAGDG